MKQLSKINIISAAMLGDGSVLAFSSSGDVKRFRVTQDGQLLIDHLDLNPPPKGFSRGSSVVA